MWWWLKDWCLNVPIYMLLLYYFLSLLCYVTCFLFQYFLLFHFACARMSKLRNLIPRVTLIREPLGGEAAKLGAWGMRWVSSLFCHLLVLNKDHVPWRPSPRNRYIYIHTRDVIVPLTCVQEVNLTWCATIVTLCNAVRDDQDLRCVWDVQ